MWLIPSIFFSIKYVPNIKIIYKHFAWYRFLENCSLDYEVINFRKCTNKN